MYARFFSSSYILSGRISGIGEPSLLSTCLLLSSFQFLNVLSVGLLIEVALGVVVYDSFWKFAVTHLVFMAVNVSYIVRGRRKGELLTVETVRGKTLGHGEYVVILYVLATMVFLFLSGAMLLNAPSN